MTDSRSLQVAIACRGRLGGLQALEVSRTDQWARPRRDKKSRRVVALTSRRCCRVQAVTSTAEVIKGPACPNSAHAPVLRGRRYERSRVRRDRQPKPWRRTAHRVWRSAQTRQGGSSTVRRAGHVGFEPDGGEKPRSRGRGGVEGPRCLPRLLLTGCGL